MAENTRSKRMWRDRSDDHGTEPPHDDSHLERHHRGDDDPEVGHVPERERDRVRGRREVVGHEQDEHGGVKIGSAFFGWLTATGMTVILTAVLAAAGTAVGVATGTDVTSVTDQASSSSGTVAGSRYDVLATLNSVPRIPVSEGDLAVGGIIAAVAVALAALIGALLGGLAGMRFHREVDRTGLGR